MLQNSVSCKQPLILLEMTCCPSREAYILLRSKMIIFICHLHTRFCFQKHVKLWNSCPSESPRNERTRSGLPEASEGAKGKLEGADKIMMVVVPLPNLRRNPLALWT